MWIQIVLCALIFEATAHLDEHEHKHSVAWGEDYGYGGDYHGGDGDDDGDDVVDDGDDGEESDDGEEGDGDSEGADSDGPDNAGREQRLFGFFGKKFLAKNLLFGGGRERVNSVLSKAMKIIHGFGFRVTPGVDVEVTQSIDTQNLVRPAAVEKKMLGGVEPCKNGQGVCMSSKDCFKQEGTRIGNCRNCLGCNICCKIVKPCQSRTDALISYFTSPGYPKTRTSATHCSLNLRIRNEVCQVRLDFLDFEMAAPEEDKCECDPSDRMEIINPRQTGVLGPRNNFICGVNKKTHMYLPVDPRSMVILKATTSGVKPVPLSKAINVRGDQAYRWDIRVTQIPCDELEKNSTVVGPFKLATTTVGVSAPIPKFYQDLRAPDGCLQYYTKSEGTFQSFTFDGSSPMLTDLDYAICLKNKKNNCGFTLRANTFSIPARDPHCDKGDVTAVAGRARAGEPVTGFNCCQRKDGSHNYLSVPPVASQNFREMFCGSFLGGAKLTRGGTHNPKSNTVVVKNKGPYIVRVKTSGQCCDNDKLPPYGASRSKPSVPKIYEGFRINYEINTGTC